MLISLIVGLLLGAASIIFAFQNIATVTVVFFQWQFTSSLALILMLAMGVGILLSFLLALPEIMKKSFHISRLKRANEQLQDEIVTKKVEVETEKSKLAATNAYLDSVEEKTII
jgi:uncharacterized integral membrane protein